MFKNYVFVFPSADNLRPVIYRITGVVKSKATVTQADENAGKMAAKKKAQLENKS
jgi:hypothetical protein